MKRFAAQGVSIARCASSTSSRSTITSDSRRNLVEGLGSADRVDMFLVSDDMGDMGTTAPRLRLAMAGCFGVSRAAI